VHHHFATALNGLSADYTWVVSMKLTPASSVAWMMPPASA